MKLRFEKAAYQYYFVYVGLTDCGSVRKHNGSWKAVSDGRGRYFHYRQEAAEWLVSINKAEQSNG